MTCFSLRATEAKPGRKHVTGHMLDCPLHVFKVKVPRREQEVPGHPSPAQAPSIRWSKSTHTQPVAHSTPPMGTLSSSRTLDSRAPLHEGRAVSSAAIWNIFKIGLIVMTQTLLDFLWN